MPASSGPRLPTRNPERTTLGLRQLASGPRARKAKRKFGAVAIAPAQRPAGGSLDRQQADVI